MTNNQEKSACCGVEKQRKASPIDHWFVCSSCGKPFIPSKNPMEGYTVEKIKNNFRCINITDRIGIEIWNEEHIFGYILDKDMPPNKTDIVKITTPKEYVEYLKSLAHEPPEHFINEISHPSSQEKDWKEEEREVWRNFIKRTLGNDELIGDISNYWLSRIESRVQEARQEGRLMERREYGSAFDKGRQEEQDRIVEIVMGMYIKKCKKNHDNMAQCIMQNCELNRDGFNEALTAIIKIIKE